MGGAFLRPALTLACLGDTLRDEVMHTHLPSIYSESR